MTVLLLAWVAAGPALVTAVTARRGSAERVARTAVVTLLTGVAAGAVLIGLTASGDAARRRGIGGWEWLALDVDRVGALLVTTFALLGTVVASFSRRAFDAGPRVADVHRSLCLLVGGASLIALPGGPVMLVVGWLASGWALDRLVRGWVDSTSAHRAIRRLRATARVGDVALVAAVAVAVGVAGPTAITGSASALGELRSSSFGGVRADIAFATLIVLAGLARSAVVPFHRWLTATLFAPTPVSAIVHAGFVGGAGLLLLRFGPATLPLDGLVVVLGALAVATIVVGTAASLGRPDAKGALAWSTVAQMAFMVLQCTIGAFSSAVVHIVGHGLYKATQFLGVGDTVAAGLRKRRRPLTDARIAPAARAVVAGVVATAGVALGLAVGPSSLATAELITVVGFAWLTIAAAANGALASGTFAPGRAIAAAALGGVGTGVTYFLGLRVAKHHLGPSLPAVGPDATLATTFAVLALASSVAVAAIVAVPALQPVRSWARHRIDRITEIRPVFDRAPMPVAIARSEPAHPAGAALRVDPPIGDAQRAELRGQVARAAETVAPQWPLSSFVAVNPLAGFEHLTFDEAATRSWRLGGRSYRSLEEFRAEHAAGATTDADLAWAVYDVAFVACAEPPISTGPGTVPPEIVITADVLHGPTSTAPARPRTELERRCGVGTGERLALDETVAAWVLDHMARPTWALEPHGTTFWSLARRQAALHARGRLSPRAVAFLDELGDEPLDALDAALRVCGVRPTDRSDELRGLFASVRGCTGLARWRSEWAAADEALPALSPLELVTARAVLEAAAVLDAEDRSAGGAAQTAAPTSDGAHCLHARADAVIERLAIPRDEASRAAVADLLTLVPEQMRCAIWQRAQEYAFDRTLLAKLDRVTESPSERPSSHVVFCIDVRSEGMRRHLEAQQADETIGFAGFFGIPMRIREVGWTHDEPRCPVLVAPHTLAVERTGEADARAVERVLGRSRRRTTAAIAHGACKHAPGAPFAMAEAAGWVTGPVAAWRTLASPRARAIETVPTSVEFVGADTDQRVFWAEAVLRTMGLTERFARIVVLCGHTSHTLNNAHATALDCGACGGAGGATNARAVAALLNDHAVRDGLRERGLAIPADTWFCGAVHETTTDDVTVLDGHLAPAGHRAELAELEQRFRVAAERQLAARAANLPGVSARVRDRGRDWAQPRPEWGLAANAAFVIAPRSTTAGLDLGGRAFLHSYDAANDPDGATLEAIMTAPLVVGHWISSQYYFSTVDPDHHGAGDKLLHNPVGTIGVVSGASGDLRVGLPLQSTHVGRTAHHQPLRLLAVIEADLMTIEAIIARNPVLQRLVSGSWIRIAARAHPHEPWATRTPSGTWSTMPVGRDAADGSIMRSDDAGANLEHA